MRVVGMVLAGLLAGCAAPTGAMYGAGRAVPQVFATQLAGPETVLVPMPTAVVVLKPGDLNRNRRFCEAFQRLPTVQAVLARKAIAPNVILTRWLVGLTELPAGAVSDCDMLVGAYDYLRAARLMQSVHLEDGRFAGPGPYLLMIVPGVGGERVVGLDGSAYDEAAFPAFIGSWSQAVAGAEQAASTGAQQPGLVRSLYDLVFAVFRTAASVPGTLLRGIVETL